MDLNEPVENPSLVKSIERLMENYSDSSENDYLKELRIAKLLAPVIISPVPDDSNSRAELKENTEVDLINITDNNDNDYLPAFSDWKELRKWNAEENIHTLIFTIQDYKKVLESNNGLKGFVINPNSHSIVMGREQMKLMDSLDANIQKDQSVKLGVPKKIPLEMIEALQEYLPNIPSVKSAYFLLMVKGERDKSYLIIIDTSDEYNTVFEKVSYVATRYIDIDEKIDFAPLDTDFGRNAVEGQEPFYLQIKD